MGKKVNDVKAYIWQNTKQVGDCWEWQKRLNPTGYGESGVGGRKVRTHRLSYSAFKGEITDGMYVLHTCHNRKCCNPDHLYLGTQQDNMNDMVAANRSTAKIDKKHYSYIKYLYDDGYTMATIARLLGVSRPAISMIINSV